MSANAKRLRGSNMNILVIDAQGGGIGRQLVTAIKAAMPDTCITAVGTNSAATAAMVKAKADKAATGENAPDVTDGDAATGENAVVVGCRHADIIVGPIGIVIADSLLGEITPKMALAVAQSDAKRVLIPFNHCDNVIVGVNDYSISKMIASAVAEVEKIAHTSC